MVLMAVLGVWLVAGVALTVAWGGARYRPWAGIPGSAGDGDGGPSGRARPSMGEAALQYLRGVAVVLVAGFWTGLLVTGSAMRLIMRLLAVTAGDEAQGRVTEADQVVGEIDLGETVGLHLFGGILPGLLSGALFVVIRRWLPAGRLGGIVFGLLHLVVAATRIDPLRPENIDFDLVGPGWLAVLTFGLAAVLHGMAVAAFANRFSRQFPPAGGGRAWWRLAPVLAPPVLILVPGFFLLMPLAIGLLVTVAVTRIPGFGRLAASRPTVLAGRVAVGVIALVSLPGALRDLLAIIDRS